MMMANKVFKNHIREQLPLDEDTDTSLSISSCKSSPVAQKTPLILLSEIAESEDPLSDDQSVSGVSFNEKQVFLKPSRLVKTRSQMHTASLN